MPDAGLEARSATRAQTIAATPRSPWARSRRIVGEAMKDEIAARHGARARSSTLLRQRGLHRGPHRLHGEAQARLQGPLIPPRTRRSGSFPVSPLHRGRTMITRPLRWLACRAAIAAVGPARAPGAAQMQPWEKQLYDAAKKEKPVHRLHRALRHRRGRRHLRRVREEVPGPEVQLRAHHRAGRLPAPAAGHAGQRSRSRRSSAAPTSATTRR